jgi:hypothetical protein
MLSRTVRRKHVLYCCVQIKIFFVELSMSKSIGEEGQYHLVKGELRISSMCNFLCCALLCPLILSEGFIRACSPEQAVLKRP